MAVEWSYNLPPNNYYLLIYLFIGIIWLLYCVFMAAGLDHVSSLVLVYLHISLNRLMIAVVLDYKKIK